jgi:hypothetical protein
MVIMARGISVIINIKTAMLRLTIRYLSGVVPSLGISNNCDRMSFNDLMNRLTDRKDRSYTDKRATLVLQTFEHLTAVEYSGKCFVILADHIYRYLRESITNVLKIEAKALRQARNNENLIILGRIIPWVFSLSCGRFVAPAVPKYW